MWQTGEDVYMLLGGNFYPQTETQGYIKINWGHFLKLVKYHLTFVQK